MEERKMLNDFCVIIPVHKVNENILSMLNTAVKSVPVDYTVVISCANGLRAELERGVTRENIAVVECEDNRSDFSTLVNNAVGNTKWFSILEFDDEFTPIWFDEVEKEMKWKSDVSVFLPLELLVDNEKKHTVGFGNEAPWASSFSNEIGYIDNDSLQQYFDYYLTGSVFNTDDWNAVGGLKESIKLVFWYEFLLRLTNNNKKAYIVPKLGYKHTVNRKDSLFDEYSKTIDEKESEWWFETAKTESFHKKDRHKSYTVETEEGYE